MALKSYRLAKGSRKKKKRRSGFSGSGDMISGGVNAIIGVSLLGVTASAVGRI